MSSFDQPSGRASPRRKRRLLASNHTVHDTRQDPLTKPCAVCGYPLLRGDKRCARCVWEGRL